MKNNKNISVQPALSRRQSSHLWALVLIFFFSFSLGAQTTKSWQWVQQLGGKGWDKACGVACDSKNNLCVAGSFYDTLKCSSKKIVSLGNQDVFIAKFTQTGDLKYLLSAGSTGQDEASCICSALNGSIAVGGFVTGKATFGKLADNDTVRRVFVTSLDAKGNFTWATTMTGKASLFMIASDSLGKIYVSGTFTDTLLAGGQKVASNGKKDIFLARVNTSGTVEKLVSFGSTEDDVPGSLSVSSGGAIALAGSFGKSFQLGDINLVSSQVRAKTNAFVAQFNQDFTAQWASILAGGDYCQVASIRYGTESNLYVAGSFNLNLWAADTVFASKGNTDAFLLKYSTDGDLQWGRSFGTWYYDYASHVNPDNLGGAIITGSLGDTLDIDSLEIDPVSKGSATMVLQFSSSGTASWGDCVSGKGRNFSDGSVLDQKGNLYLTGSFRKAFEKGMYGLTSLGDQDVFLAKYYICPTTKADIIGERAFCPGLGTVLSVKSGFKKVVWNDTLTGSNYILASKAGSYWVSMYNSKGCLLADTVEITQAPQPVFSLGNDTTLLLGDSIVLRAPADDISYLWNDYTTGTTCLAKPTDGNAGQYPFWLTVTDSLSCNYTDTISINFVKGLTVAELELVQLVAYPNPVSDVVYWYLKTDQPYQVIVQFSDEHGHVLYSQSIEQYSQGQVKQIPVSSLPAGTYYIRLNSYSTGQNFKTVKVIKQ